jgi:hypothetical protein
MAESHDLDEILVHLAGLYGARFKVDSARTKAWGVVFEAIPGPELWRAVHVTLASPEHHEFPPTPMQIAANVSRTAGATIGSHSAPCPDCAALPGYREMAIRFVLPDGRHDARAVLAACECRLGETRRASGVLPWREQQARWKDAKARLIADGGAYIDGAITSAKLPMLTSAHRYTDEVRARGEGKAHSNASAFLFAALRGTDAHAGERAMAVEQDRARDERGWEVAS